MAIPTSGEVHAQVVTESMETNSTLEMITERLESLQELLRQREIFGEIGSLEKSDDDPEYFLFRPLDENPVVFGSKQAELLFLTDGSVDQILVAVDCPVNKSVFNLNCISASEFPLTDENFNQNEFSIKSKQLLK